MSNKHLELFITQLESSDRIFVLRRLRNLINKINASLKKQNKNSN